jgi:hypothetical protein
MGIVGVVILLASIVGAVVFMMALATVPAFAMLQIIASLAGIHWRMADAAEPEACCRNPLCGLTNRAGAVFCARCGRKVGASEERAWG